MRRRDSASVRTASWCKNRTTVRLLTISTACRNPVRMDWDSCARRSLAQAIVADLSPRKTCKGYHKKDKKISCINSSKVVSKKNTLKTGFRYSVGTNLH